MNEDKFGLEFLIAGAAGLIGGTIGAIAGADEAYSVATAVKNFAQGFALGAGAYWAVTVPGSYAVRYVVDAAEKAAELVEKPVWLLQEKLRENRNKLFWREQDKLFREKQNELYERLGMPQNMRQDR